MPPVTIAFGLIMIALGAVFYFDTQAVTALIPAFAGIVFVLLGVLGFKEGLRKHVMHAAAALGLLGALATGAMGVPKLIKHLSGGDVERPAAAIEQSLFALICLAFVILCVRSFIAARRARAARNEQSDSSGSVSA